MVVLILSSPSDPHAQAVLAHVQALGKQCQIWNYSQFVQQTAFSFAPTASPSNSNYLRFDDERCLHLSEIESVWLRRPGAVRSALMPEPWVEAMVESECRNTLGGMLRSLGCLLVNHPGRDSDSLFKLSQLSAAKRVGLTVPETLVTNEPDQVREFSQRHNGALIYKMIGENSNFCFPAYEIPSGIPTLPLRSVDLDHLEQVKFAPHLFQQRVDKDFEVRATVVGEQIFAVSIESQKGQSKLDWRQDYGVPMRHLTMPAEVAEACLAMMRIFSLNYAAFDFCVDHQGRYFFLELNCAGQYMWLEQRLELPISKQMALLLGGEAKPIVGTAGLSNE